MSDAPRTTAAPPPEAFARLFESVHEGVYIGTLSNVAAHTLYLGRSSLVVLVKLGRL